MYRKLRLWQMGTDLKKTFLYFSLALVLLFVWQVLGIIGWLNPVIIPSLPTVFRSFGEYFSSGELLRHIGVSMIRVLEGFGLAASLGIVLGLAIGLSRTLDRMTDLLIQILKPIPPIAWIPLAIIWFGIGEASKIFIIFIGAFYPILISVVDGIRRIDPKLIELAKILEVPRRRFIKDLVLPGILPPVMTGLRVGLGIAWMCVVAAELIAASEGVGYLIMDARQLSQPDVVIVGMFTIGVIGKLMDSFLRWLSKRVLVWNVTYQGE
ncbi:MAG TPA: ABC transporter permease [Bacillota bacterium]|nr:ABC transporter permease [Bacillota bacterium]